MSHPNFEYMRQHLAPLVGCTVTEIMDAGEGFTALVLERDGQRFECVLASDMELNEPGFLFMRPAEQPRQRRRAKRKD